MGAVVDSHRLRMRLDRAFSSREKQAGDIRPSVVVVHQRLSHVGDDGSRRVENDRQVLRLRPKVIWRFPAGHVLVGLVSTALKLYRTAQLLCLFAILVVLILLLRRPQRLIVQQVASPATQAANAEAFQNKLGQLEQAHASGQPGAETRISSEEVFAALGAANPQPITSNPLTSDTSLTADQVPVKDQQVVFDGDQVKGQFTTQIAGKDVVVTFSGKLGAKNGYLDFVPISFQVGSLPIPASLVQEAFEKKVLNDSATKDKLRLPDFVNDIKIENGQLVLVEK